MSTFSDAFASAFPVSQDIFGEAVTIAGKIYTGIVDLLDLTQGVRSGLNAGRSQDASGSITLSQADWTDAKLRLTDQGKKTRGAQVTTASGTFRVLNDPDVGQQKDTVQLVIGPLT